MSYRDYRWEPTINTDGDNPEGCGFGLILIAFVIVGYWIS